MRHLAKNQYILWIVLLFHLMVNQTQKRITEYAHSILDCGMPAGELIIDDGKWEFDGKVYSDQVVVIDAPIDKLVYFKRVK